MGACHDPYKELEVYLEKAQEEIGKAFEELLQYEKASLTPEADTVLLPPPAFRSSRLSSSYHRRAPEKLIHSYSRPVCNGENASERKHENHTRGNHSPFFLQKSLSCPSPESHFSSNKQFYSSDKLLSDRSIVSWERHATKKLRPTQSFPEGAMDTLLREQVLPSFTLSNGTKSLRYNNESHHDTRGTFNTISNGYVNSDNGRLRRKGRFSHIAANVQAMDSCNEPPVLPRPPSGDMNLLSIWADNFVLAVDKSLSEVDESIPTSSPTSEYSPKMNMCDEKGNFELNTYRTLSEGDNVIPRNNSSISDKKRLQTKSLQDPKLMTSSPDSGISQVDCYNSEDVVDFTKCYENVSCDPGLSLKLKIDLIRNFEDFDATQCITPPPPEFEDPKETSFQLNYDSEAEKTNGFGAVKTFEGPQKRDVEVQAKAFRSVGSSVDGLLCDSIEFVDTTKVSDRVSALRFIEIPTNASTKFPDTETSAFCSTEVGKSDERTVENFYPTDEKVGKSSTLPKQITRAPESERLTYSLPRDAGRGAADAPQLRKMSASSSAVSSLSQVSMDELAAFMRKVKTSTYHPPPRADVCVDAKDDLNRDAVTQTTPVVPLSRSSSFTWVTECDCSDWDSLIRSTSEDSLLAFSRSVSDPDKRLAPGSTSSSPTTEDDGFEVPQNSGGSSLYLSACSEASDSHVSDSSQDDKAKTPDSTTTADPSTGTELVKSDAEEISNSANTADSVKSSFSAATLVDFAENSATCETLSLDSASSRSISSDHPASFPSTLKAGSSSRATDDGVYRHYPIEANVWIINELNAKSVSAPVLLRKKRQPLPKPDVIPKGDVTIGADSENQTPPPSYSTKEWNELQAFEACTWLRGAGFPQYAQMYEDNLFPIDIPTVQKDHSFLSPDSLQSLFRRLNTLNRCAQMKLAENVTRKSFQLDDSDDEEDCALSENWQFQRVSRRWSRVPSPTDISNECSNYINEHSSSKPPIHQTVMPVRKYLTPDEVYSSSHDSVFLEEQQSSPDSSRKCNIRNVSQCPSVLALRDGRHSPGSSSGSGGTLSAASEETFDKRLDTQQKIQRSGSDRIKESAKALLRRMESLKGKRKKKSDQATDSLHSADGSSYRSLSPSPQSSRSERMCKTDISDIHFSGTPELDCRKRGMAVVHNESSAHSDSECLSHPASEIWKDTTENVMPSQYELVGPEVHANQTHDSAGNKTKDKIKSRNTNIFKSRIHKKGTYSSRNNYYASKQSSKFSSCDSHPAPIAVFNTACVENLDKNISGKSADNAEHGNEENNEGEIIIVCNERRDSGVGASLTRASSQCYAPWHSFPEQKSALLAWPTVISISELSASQMLLLRKLSLLKLTTLMEKFSPSSRTVWSWILPKLFRRNRTPDYKDKVVFGLPLINVLQRTGHPLPSSIQAAINHLQKTCLDSSGLFRKSGVRSRIQKLRNLIEADPDNVNYEEQQPYDIADMLKQYFRELPEALLTNKLSDIYITIFQHIPEHLRLEAIQATVMLMPDENREVLYTLLSFLHDVCKHSGENQMTATNIAVCFAPSLFHRASPRSASASPRRRKTVGGPDLKELNDNRAAYECLACMVMNYNHLNLVTLDSYSQSRFACVSDGQTATLSELPDLISEDSHGWQAYIYGCIQSLLKEAKDKYKGWSNGIHSNGVELCCKKINDNHNLRLWKASTEVEAPPTELLNRILRERHVWDTSLMKWKVLLPLDKQTEIFQFVCNSAPPHPPCDYCTIRSWRTELPKGACVLVEASITYPDAKLLVDGVRGIILASRYLIEPCGSGKSRVAHLCRVDTRGRSPDWYNRAYGHICALNLKKLRDSFSHRIAEGRETKV